MAAIPRLVLPWAWRRCVSAALGTPHVALLTALALSFAVRGDDYDEALCHLRSTTPSPYLASSSLRVGARATRVLLALERVECTFGSLAPREERQAGHEQRAGDVTSHELQQAGRLSSACALTGPRVRCTCSSGQRPCARTRCMLDGPLPIVPFTYLFAIDR